MKDILNFIVSELVEDTKALEINQSEESGTLILSIKVAKDDMGKVIGKGGKVIRAIRSVMKIPSIKQNKRVYIQLAEQ